MNVAFIPVRGGSKSIPLKNIKPICGKPLVYWTVKAACECSYIDKVYVATDSAEICETLQKCCNEVRNDRIFDAFSKLEIIGRSAESASDTAPTEFAMLEFADKYEFDNIVLIQATSPLLTADNLDRGFETFESDDVNSVLSVVRQKRFNWSVDDEGFAHPSNYDVFHRPRRQEFDGYLVENGAFYITSKELLMESKNRVSGNIKAVEMPEETFFEIDEPSDWEIIEGLMRKRLGDRASKLSKNDSCCDNFGSKQKIPEIKMFLTDCDGCLTDAGMYYSPDGDFLKKFNTKDGMGIRLLRERGILVGIVTGENVDINKRRVEKLKIDIYEPGCKDKKGVVERLCKENGIMPENVVFVGDDINDLEAMEYVGYPCTVADGHKSVKAVAKYIANEPGGHGAVREIIDHILGE
ncbi:acylneuraminate cytidylyltransferase [Butyrivibrio sp. AE3004]|uniref:acylneuraminate cytidylyltransferase n=1 Tax=Butyrivibrio sp. AE3004 TaxID=1506994 RepID=UPI000493D31A|nr:acylneuraminate cytidylyltransferase [Butyrivibrio sp. AE3004]